MHAICVDTQVELNHVLYWLGRYGLICGNHLDGCASSPVYLILGLLSTVYVDLRGKGGWFRVGVIDFFIPSDVVILLLKIILGALSLTIRLVAWINDIDIVEWSSDLHRFV